MRWLSRSWAAAQAVVTALFLAALGLGGLELLARAWPDDPPAPRATADAFQGQPDAEATLDVVYSGQLQTRFAPFVHFTLAPHDGPLIEIDAEGRRRVPGTATSTRAPTVWMFGGSTMWGMGARDEGTIPAHLTRLLGHEVRVVNFGQVGYLSTQEVLTLLLELQAGRRPDVAVFYDGVNEVFPALKLGQAGLPLDVARRRAEFNITRPDALPRLTGAALTGLVRFLPAPPPLRPSAGPQPRRDAPRGRRGGGVGGLRRQRPGGPRPGRGLRLRDPLLLAAHGVHQGPAIPRRDALGGGGGGLRPPVRRHPSPGWGRSGQNTWWICPRSSGTTRAPPSSTSATSPRRGTRSSPPPSSPTSGPPFSVDARGEAPDLVLAPADSGTPEGSGR